MPETVGEAFVAIRPETTGFGAELNASLGSTLKSFAETVGAIFVASKVTGFFKSATDAAYQQVKIQQQTAAVIKSTGESANVSAGHVDELAKSLSRLTGVDDDTIHSAENLVLTFRDIRNAAGQGNDIFDQTVKVVLDMSKALGEDLKSASIQVGKALEDPTLGLTALRRVGVAFTQQQREQIQAMLASGNLLGAQKIILKELATEFGGSAAAQATAADKARVAMDDLKKSIGTALIPVEEEAAKVIGGVAEAFNSLPTPVKEAIVDIGTLALAVGGGVLAFKKLEPILSPLGGLLKSFAGDLLSAAAAAGPYVLAAAAIAATAYGIYRAFTEQASVSVKLGDISGITAKQMDQLAATVLRAGKVIGSTAVLQKTFNDILAKSPGQAQPFIDALTRAGVNTADFRAQLAKHVDETVRAQQAQQKYQQALDRANFLQVAGQLREYVKEIGDGTQATEAFRNITQDAQKALQGLQDALLAQTDAQFAYDKAVKDVATAQSDLNDAIAQHGADSQEAKDATDNLREAQERLAGATLTLDGKTSDLNDKMGGSTDAIDAEIARLKDLQARYPESAAAIQPLIDKLEYLRGLEAQLGHNLAISLSIDDSQATAALQNLQNLINQTAGTYGAFEVLLNGGGSALSGQRAGGGPVGPGTWLVGERGPELLTLGASGKGYVTDAAGTRQAMSGGGGDTINVAFYTPVPDPVQTARAIHAKHRARDFLRV